MNTDYMHYHALFGFTKLRIESARRIAKSGQKDSARALASFIRNAKIIEILRGVEFPAFLNVDVALLGWELGQLESECHPQHVADFSDDLTAIYTRLDSIAGAVSTLISSNSRSVKPRAVRVSVKRGKITNKSKKHGNEK